MTDTIGQQYHVIKFHEMTSERLRNTVDNLTAALREIAERADQFAYNAPNDDLFYCLSGMARGAIDKSPESPVADMSEKEVSTYDSLVKACNSLLNEIYGPKGSPIRASEHRAIHEIEYLLRCMGRR